MIKFWHNSYHDVQTIFKEFCVSQAGQHYHWLFLLLSFCICTSQFYKIWPEFLSSFTPLNILTIIFPLPHSIHMHQSATQTNWPQIFLSSSTYTSLSAKHAIHIFPLTHSIHSQQSKFQSQWSQFVPLPPFSMHTQQSNLKIQWSQ